MNKKIALILLGLFAAAWNATPAQALVETDLNNSAFTLDSPARGVVDADPSPVGGINDTANPDGFNNLFDSTGGNTFLLLGADDPTQTIDAGSNETLDRGGDVTANSPSFVIDHTDSTVNVAFDWSFQGTNNDQSDELTVTLEGVDPGNSGDIADALFVDQYGSGRRSANIDVSGFSFGNYQLFINLNENRRAGNSAAGFDDIVVTEVPFGAAPNTGLLILGGMYAVSSYRKRRKMSK